MKVRGVYFTGAIPSRDTNEVYLRDPSNIGTYEVGCEHKATIHDDVNILVVITGVKSPQLMGADERQGGGIQQVR